MPNARESRFTVARAAIDAREFSAAREALETLALEKPTARACLLMAELEEVESGNAGLVRSWLARASRAPRDPAWVADGLVSDRWAAVSPVTGRIGAFEWREPPQAAETHLRARIDADRFEAPLESPLVIEAAPVPVPSPEPAAAPEPLLQPEEKDREEKSSEEKPPEEKPAPASAFAEFRPIIPDDPGPEPGSPKAKTGFRFFG